MVTGSIPQQRRALRAEVRRRKREVLPKLRDRVRLAKARRKKRIARCKVDAKRAIKRAEREAKKAQAEIRKQLRVAKRKANQVGSACRISARGEGIERVEKAIQALSAELEKIRELAHKAATMRSSRGRAGGLRAAELRGEADDRVRFNIGDDPYLLALFEKVKRQIKASPFRTRTEAFFEYVHDNPEALDEVRAKKEREYEREAERLFAERAATDPAALEEAELELELERLYQAERWADNGAEVPF